MMLDDDDDEGLPSANGHAIDRLSNVSLTPGRWIEKILMETE